MSNEEKILEILTQMQGEMSGLGGRMERLESGQAALEGRMERVKGDLTFIKLRLDTLAHNQAALEGRMGRVETTLEEMKTTQGKLEDELHGVKAYLELDVEKRFDGVNEGIDTILERLEPQEQMEERVDQLEDAVIVLKTAVKLHSTDIAELKKAQ